MEIISEIGTLAATRLPKMPSSEMWHRVALVTTDVSDEGITSIIRMERISEV
jgi:hypothetical protein